MTRPQPHPRRPRRILVTAAVVCCVAVALRARADLAPQRIVSLAPSLTELVFALGVGSRVVGVTRQCDYPPEARSLPKVGTFLAPNIEAVLAARPDIVLVTPSPANQRPVERLRQLGVRLLVVDPRSIADLERSFRTVAEALGVPQKGDTLAAAFLASIRATRERVAHCPVRKVLLVVSRQPLIAAGRDTIQHEIIELAGGLNVVARVGRGWPRLSLEFVLQAAPEIVWDASMGSDTRDTDEAAAFWQRFPDLPAVRQGQVLLHADDRLLRPGPRLPEGLRELAEKFHPDCARAARIGEALGAR